MENNVTFRQAQLIRSLRWRQEIPSDEYIKHIGDTAIPMLTYLACLNYFMIDLETDLRADNKFRGGVSVRFKQCSKIVTDAHQEAFKMFGRIDAETSRGYNDALDDAYRVIDENLPKNIPHRSYNIVVAICRIFDNLNRSLGERFCFAPAKYVKNIPSLLEVIGYKDERIDDKITVLSWE